MKPSKPMKRLKSKYIYNRNFENSVAVKQREGKQNDGACNHGINGNNLNVSGLNGNGIDGTKIEEGNVRFYLIFFVDRSPSCAIHLMIPQWV